MANLSEQFPGNLLPGEIPGGGAGSIDTGQVIDELLPHLHARSRSDADLTFWTEAQLFEWVDEALKRLARKTAVFVGLDTSNLTVPGRGLYPLPLQHDSTIHVSFNGQVLRPASVQDLELRDSGFESTPGFPDHWYQNLLGLASIGLTPVPDGEGLLVQVYEGWPPQVDAGQTMVTAPPPLKGYLAHAVLAECYGREGECETPDLAEHCRARVAMYEQAFIAYYGPGK